MHIRIKSLVITLLRPESAIRLLHLVLFRLDSPYCCRTRLHLKRMQKDARACVLFSLLLAAAEQYAATKPPVAACITGHVRTLNVTAHNIFETMIAPIRDHVDVFVAVSPLLDDLMPPKNVSHPKFPSESGPHKKGETPRATSLDITRWFSIFSPIHLEIAGSAGQNSGLHSCLLLVQRHERQRCSLYRYLLRLRPDVAYQTRLPEWASWRHSLRLPVAEGPRFVLSEVLGGFPEICVKDVWALMTREAASAYLARDWLPCSGDRAKQSKRMYYPECRLGCTLRRKNVTTWTVPLKRVIVRAWHGATHLPNATTRLSISTANRSAVR